MGGRGKGRKWGRRKEDGRMSLRGGEGGEGREGGEGWKGG